MIIFKKVKFFLRTKIKIKFRYREARGNPIKISLSRSIKKKKKNRLKMTMWESTQAAILDNVCTCQRLKKAKLKMKKFWIFTHSLLINEKYNEFDIWSILKDIRYETHGMQSTRTWPVYFCLLVKKNKGPKYFWKIILILLIFQLFTIIWIFSLSTHTNFIKKCYNKIANQNVECWRFYILKNMK